MRTHGFDFMMIKTHWNFRSFAGLIATVVLVVAAFLALHLLEIYHDSNGGVGIHGWNVEPMKTHDEDHSARGAATSMAQTILHGLFESAQWHGTAPHVAAVHGIHSSDSTLPSFWAAPVFEAVHNDRHAAYSLALTVHRCANAHGSRSNEHERILEGFSHSLTHAVLLNAYFPTIDLVFAAYHMGHAIRHLVILTENAWQLAHCATDSSSHVAESGGTPPAKTHPVTTNHDSQCRPEAFHTHPGPAEHWAAVAHHIRHALLHVFHVLASDSHGLHPHNTHAGEIHEKFPHRMNGYSAAYSLQKKTVDNGIMMEQRCVGVRDAVFLYGTRYGIPGPLGTGAYRRTVHCRESRSPDMHQGAWGLGHFAGCTAGRSLLACIEGPLY